jgi:serine/threonine protein kinase
MSLFLGRFRILRKLGEGAFGEVVEAFDVLSQHSVAIKVGFDSRMDAGREAHVHQLVDGVLGFPRFYSSGMLQNQGFLVLESLGPSLELLRQWCAGRFSLATVCRIGHQMIALIEELHQVQLVHRDLKPANFLIGRRERRNQLHLIDFGLARCYRRFDGVTHQSFRTNCAFVGNARYASVNAHMGCEQSRRDDMEAIVFMLIDFLTGSLPWVESSRNATVLKATTSIEVLCAGAPSEFADILAHIRALEFEQKPDYSSYKHKLVAAVGEDCCELPLDWEANSEVSEKLAAFEKLPDAPLEWAPPEKMAAQLPELKKNSPVASRDDADPPPDAKLTARGDARAGRPRIIVPKSSLRRRMALRSLRK